MRTSKNALLVGGLGRRFVFVVRNQQVLGTTVYLCFSSFIAPGAIRPLFVI